MSLHRRDGRRPQLAVLLVGHNEVDPDLVAGFQLRQVVGVFRSADNAPPLPGKSKCVER